MDDGLNDDLNTVEGAEQLLAYIREVRSDELDLDHEQYDEDGEPLYALHDENGRPLAVFKDRATAIVMARVNDMTPQSVH